MNIDQSIDILMITYNRAEYTRLSLQRLLDTCDSAMRIWLWHNGEHTETLDVVRSMAAHPRVFKFHHSPENKRLTEPTNWLWRNARGAYLGKVDDDCLLPHDWASRLRETHLSVPKFGVVCCWHFHDEDFIPELANRKIESFACGNRILRNCWVAGSGYLMKRACVEQCGLLPADMNFTQYCIRLARAGWINGWRYPFLLQEHMDDPRSPNSLLRTDQDLAEHLPLSARHLSEPTIEGWIQQLRRSARIVQEASVDPRQHVGVRKKFRRIRKRLTRAKLMY